MKNQLFEKLDTAFEEMQIIRRYLHMHPEVSFQETNTAKYIQDFYAELGIDFTPNVGGNGVVARVKGALPGKTVALQQTLMHYPSKMKKKLSTNRRSQVLCMHVVTMVIPLRYWF